MDWCSVYLTPQDLPKYINLSSPLIFPTTYKGIRTKNQSVNYGADLMKAQFEECKMWNIDSISAQICILTDNGLTDTHLFTI
jgi:hypothetical protein